MKLSYAGVLIPFLLSLPCIAQDMPGGKPLTPLERILKPDGTVRLDGSFHGTLDPTGWHMRTDVDGKPKFVQHVESTETVPEDSMWDVRFGAPGMNGGVYALAVIGTDLYAGGSFSTASGVSPNHIAKWNGTRW